MRHPSKLVFGIILASATLGAIAFLHAESPSAPDAAAPAANAANDHYQLCANNQAVFLLDTTSGATWASAVGSTKWTPQQEALSK